VPVWRPVLGRDLQPNVKQDLDVKMEDVPSDANHLRPPPEFPQFSVQELLQKGTLLLSSSGKEFVKPANLLANPLEVKRARKAAMSRLGLDFLDAVADDDGMDWEKELADDPDVDTTMAPPDVKIETAIDAEPISPIPVVADATSPITARPLSASLPSGSSTPAPLAEVTPTDEDLAGMSARERNRLKRKRKGGASAFVLAPPPAPSGAKYNTTNASGSKYVRCDLVSILY
jgi:TATA-binding protein-associated factor